MKKNLLLLVVALFSVAAGNAQNGLLPDQNPNFAVSRDKYMQLADSVNQWHSTTLQNTYEANDWMAKREKNRQFRQQLRLERARWDGYNYRNDGYYSYPYRYRNDYYNYYNQPRSRRGFRWW
ncbi:MAG: hypothetical protein IPP93_01795 [Chitinophagaceae bacterium]|nr:hypothetical protein [Chitinophagaceae bacterium]MBL0336386.1 hypothetical protein [Chitinophagaceae bacterium]